MSYGNYLRPSNPENVPDGMIIKWDGTDFYATDARKRKYRKEHCRAESDGEVPPTPSDCNCIVRSTEDGGRHSSSKEAEKPAKPSSSDVKL